MIFHTIEIDEYLFFTFSSLSKSANFLLILTFLASFSDRYIDGTSKDELLFDAFPSRHCCSSPDDLPDLQLLVLGPMYIPRKIDPVTHPENFETFKITNSQLIYEKHFQKINIRMRSDMLRLFQIKIKRIGNEKIVTKADA